MTFEHGLTSLAQHWADVVRGPQDAKNYEVMLAAFGVPAGEPISPELEYLADSCLKTLRSMYSPLSGYLEAPPVIIRLSRTHGRGLSDAVDLARQRTLDLLADVMSLGYRIPAGASVSHDELVDRGYVDIPDDDW